MGGPNLYSERKGHPALIGRHKTFDVSERGAERWIEHMTAAFDEVPEIDEDSQRRMMSFLRHTAYFIHSGLQTMRERQAAQEL